MPLTPLEVDFRILGPLEAVVRRAPVPLGGPKQRAVLAVLLLRLDEVVSSDFLIDVVWGEHPPASAEATLRTYLSRLRGSLVHALGDKDEPLISGGAGGYVLSVPPECLDARRFGDLVAEGAAMLPDRPQDAAYLLRQALGLWRGDPLGEFTYHDFAVQEIARLEELRLVALGHCIDAELRCGQHAGLVAELQSLVRQYPLREGFHVQLMQVLASEGNRAEALAVYGRARTILRRELALEPGPELRSLATSIRREQSDARSRPARREPARREPARREPERREQERREPTGAIPAVGATAAPASRLPAVMTSFVGRHHEVAEVTGLLEHERLVTITGAGGSGKTRMAMELAADMALRPGKFVLFVELADVASNAVHATVAVALNVRVQGDASLLDALADALGARATLLVLDNCEHVIDEVATLAAKLLARCPGLALLATSREPLAVTGERVWRIPSLSLPERVTNSLAVALRSDAVRLFLERAATARPDLHFGDDDAGLVLEICHRLDGLPLAIELAAARLAMLSVTELVDRLDDQLGLLRGRSRDVPTRHRAVQDAIDWSYTLLSSTEQQLFARLSVFRGTFDLDAVVAVCAWGELGAERMLDVLEALVDKSLVVRVSDAAGSAQYRLLETLRQYAAERLGASEREIVPTRHARFFTDQAASITPLLRGPDAPVALEWLDRHRDDERAALLRLDATANLELVELVAAVWPYWDYRCLVAEGRQWLQRALVVDGSGTDSGGQARLAVLAGAAKLAYVDDDSQAATGACWEGLALAAAVGSRPARAPFLVVLGDLGRERNAGGAVVHAYGAEAAELYREIGDLSGAGDAMRVLALHAWDRGDLAKAEEWARSCVAVWDRCQDNERSAGARLLLGGLALERGLLDEAERRYEDSLQLFQLASEPWGTAEAVWSLATLANLKHEPRRALALAEDSLERHQQLGLRRGVAKSLKAMADAQLQLRWLDQAEQSAEAALARFRERGFHRDLEGALLTLAGIKLRRGQLDLASEMLEESLRGYREDGHRGMAAVGLAMLGVVADLRGDRETASRLNEESNEVAGLDSDRRIVNLVLSTLSEGVRVDIDLSGSSDLSARK
jgi:predicted ATPase/DNA-binding SARP family transcriptional activator